MLPEKELMQPAVPNFYSSKLVNPNHLSNKVQVQLCKVSKNESYQKTFRFRKFLLSWMTVYYKQDTALFYLHHYMTSYFADFFL